jgi:hypothetical protein
MSSNVSIKDILAILEDNPDDYSKVAKKLKITRAEVLSILADNPDAMSESRDSYLDELTAQYKLYILGRCKVTDFNANHALKLLERERPEVWASRIDERGKAKEEKGKTKGPKRSFLEAVDSISRKPVQETIIQEKAEDFSLRFPLPLSDISVTSEDLASLSELNDGYVVEEVDIWAGHEGNVEDVEEKPLSSYFSLDPAELPMPSEEEISFEDDDLFELEEII